jgi:HupE / UreJ protein
VLRANRRVRRTLFFAGAAAVVGLLLTPPASAHEIPTDVRVLAFVKPEGERLHLLVRVPLGAMRDVDYPTRGPGYLDVARAVPSLRHAAKLWIADAVELYEDETPLPPPRLVAARVSLPLDGAFETWEEARTHVAGPPLPADVDLYWNQGMLDVWFEYAIQSPTSRFSIHAGFARLGLRVVTALRFLPPGGAIRAFELDADPGLVRLDPRWHQAALRFVELGFFHILDGTDHLLFLLCLVIPYRRLRALILVVTAFTVAHSMTLIASAFDVAPRALWFPPLIETLIALSIVYMALENIVAPPLRRRWLIAFGFGLVHGFGFSFALRETLQFAGSHLLTSLLSFNVGVELGQLLVLIVLVPVLNLALRLVPERTGTIILSALVAHTGWHWTLERWERLRQFRWEWPALNAALLASALRWVMLAVVAAGIVWIVFGLLLRPERRRLENEPASGADE